MCNKSKEDVEVNEFELTTKLKVDRIKLINKLHFVYNIVYLSIIFILIILVIIVACKYRVGDTAMVNFTFAATVVSIVLAVVSIVYTLVSGGSMMRYFGKFDLIEKRLENEVDNIKRLNQDISEILQHTRDIDKRMSKSDHRNEKANPFDSNSSSQETEESPAT